jgi:hypothetical protein
VAGEGVTLVDSAEATADAVSLSVGQAAAAGEGRVLHFVTGDAAAFAHTARVIGGVAGEIRLLPVTELSDGRCGGARRQ